MNIHEERKIIGRILNEGMYEQEKLFNEIRGVIGMNAWKKEDIIQVLEDLIHEYKIEEQSNG